MKLWPLVVVLALGLCDIAQAKNFPARPITMIVP